MLSKKDILDLFEELNNKLKKKEVIGEIAIVGGAVMCMVYRSRPATRNIDAIFEPKKEIYEAIEEIAKERNLNKDWLNDSVKGFVDSSTNFKIFKKLNNLKIYTPTPEYLLALKCYSARTDSYHDVNDIKFLVKFLNLKTYLDVEKIILKYIPKNRLLPRTKYILLEILGE